LNTYFLIYCALVVSHKQKIYVARKKDALYMIKLMQFRIHMLYSSYTF